MSQARVFVAGSDAPEEISGADVVVVKAADSEAWAERVRVRAPNAVVVVVGESPAVMCEGTLFPRSRIIGVATELEAEAVLEAIANDLGKEMEVIVRCLGERGIEDDFVRAPVRVGASGIREIVDP